MMRDNNKRIIKIYYLNTRKYKWRDKFYQKSQGELVVKVWR